jgi:maltooligosyltrehalose trehalohydrolase
VLLTSERHGYYSDYGKAPLRDIARSLGSGFVYQGEASAHRGGRPRGQPSGALSPLAFVNFLQNHDQIGNRALGDRPALTPGKLAIGAALVITSPYTPMLFMGEEWGASTPWRYFTDHTEPSLAEAVRVGRRREFAAYGWDAEEIPDPQDPATWRSSVLSWSELDESPHRELLGWYRELLALRARSQDLRDDRLTSVEISSGDSWLVVRRGGLRVVVNLSADEVVVPVADVPAYQVLSFGTATIVTEGVQITGESVAIFGN